ncbi:MAG: peptidoglycan DD-metalloendopeptidase family protein [gamma proteobacterium symbiont of Bathyaustriella thionipta]|nr:peptidoglycan DD-metalloendopeptidase family protein [gamma proteobacterium symbiont of Bathyaustriella thionipta]MCU7950918.1 peptidoglycan DD-metalloendopeptidase family protein [gamma proteobacterium symbiont of Bathyaustriella thionipta]MCU7951819.1 peptidoglycan DD-metalloendopeptidase family protein [gamma proteobacterium symbiont of Bathyaustriella thionipta]MCU7957395.1 peptidoglycan DD-metalloendopeptidase family protein [gamma proteobacterium symbiont of Bathyaustriella thionipta]M
MNYSSFLNKDNKFKSKNHYRLENKKKNSKIFLFSSVLTIAVLSLVITFFIDIDHNAVAKTSKSTSFSTSLSQTQTSPLDLPEIAYASEGLSEPVIYSETPAQAAKEPVQKQITSNVDMVELTQMVTPDVTNSITEELLSTKATIQDTVISSIKNTTIVKTQSIKTKQKTSETISTQEVTSITPLETTTTQKVIVKKGDTLSAIFKRLSLSGSTLHNIINASKQAKKLTRIKPGQALVITFDVNKKFKSLHYDLDRVDSLIVEKTTGSKQYTVRIESKEIDIRQQFASGKITNSLFSAANKAGLSSAMTMRLAQLFGWDIDFALDIRKGDSFAILFEEKYINDKKIGNGNILSAEFVNKGKVFTAVRYTDAANHTDYYSQDGLSMRKAFLRSPVDFSRISSRFSYGRKHPVLNKIRAHKGVDYAASRGTPIKAVGDGKVIFKGRKGGYGRVIILQHGSKYSTLYAHMNSYNKKMKHGTRVKQGQIIGYVGSSGLATGPHLHYEFRMNGVQRNPLTVPLPSASPIAKKYRSDFQATAETMVSQLKLRKQQTVALTER